MLVVNLFGTPGAGKCFSKGTKILMYDGSIKNVEDIKIGDIVMGDDSTPRSVLELHSGVSPMYLIKRTLSQDIVVSANHMITLLREYGKPKRWIFGEKYNEYPIVCIWVFDGEVYTYSIFSSDPTVNCSVIAESFGGGGHKGAAGFSSKELLFKAK